MAAVRLANARREMLGPGRFQLAQVGGERPYRQGFAIELDHDGIRCVRGNISASGNGAVEIGCFDEIMAARWQSFIYMRCAVDRHDALPGEVGPRTEDGHQQEPARHRHTRRFIERGIPLIRG